MHVGRAKNVKEIFNCILQTQPLPVVQPCHPVRQPRESFYSSHEHDPMDEVLLQEVKEEAHSLAFKGIPIETKGPTPSSTIMNPEVTLRDVLTFHKNIKRRPQETKPAKFDFSAMPSTSRLPPTSPKRYRQFAPPPISMKQSPKICAKTVSCPSTSEVKSPPKKMIIQKIQKHQEAPKPAKVPKIKGEKKKKDGRQDEQEEIDIELKLSKSTVSSQTLKRHNISFERKPQRGI